MAQSTIVDDIAAKTDKVDLIKTELEELVYIARAEEGCRQYDLHQDSKKILLISCFIKTGIPGALANAHGWATSTSQTTWPQLRCCRKLHH